MKVTSYTALAYSYYIVSTICLNSKATPTNNTNYSSHTKAIIIYRTCLTNHMESIHITPLFTSSKEVETRTCMHTNVVNKSNLRNQTHTGLLPARPELSWFFNS